MGVTEIAAQLRDANVRLTKAETEVTKVRSALRQAEHDVTAAQKKNSDAMAMSRIRGIGGADEAMRNLAAANQKLADLQADETRARQAVVTANQAVEHLQRLHTEAKKFAATMGMADVA